MAKRQQGIISSWNDDRGFGFVDAGSNGPRIFLHIKAFRHRDRRPMRNERVLFRLGKDEKGRPRAEDVAFADETSIRKPRRGGRVRSNSSVTFAWFFLLLVVASAVVTSLPWQVPAAYFMLSLATYVLFARDKSAAQNGRWRTSENTLLVMALLGGWPGALVAQQTLRHKSKKVSFRIGLWLTVLLNVAVLVWLHTPSGQAELQRVIMDLDAIVRPLLTTVAATN